MKMIAIKDSKERGNATITVLCIFALLFVVTPAYFWLDDYIEDIRINNKYFWLAAITRSDTTSGTPDYAYSSYLIKDAFKTYYALTPERGLEIRVNVNQIDPDYLSSLVDVYNEMNTEAGLSLDEVNRCLRTFDPSCEEFKTSTPESLKSAYRMLAHLERWLADEQHWYFYDTETGQKLLPDKKSPGDYHKVLSKNGTRVMQRYYDYRYILTYPLIYSSQKEKGDSNAS